MIQPQSMNNIVSLPSHYSTKASGGASRATHFGSFENLLHIGSIASQKADNLLSKPDTPAGYEISGTADNLSETADTAGTARKPWLKQQSPQDDAPPQENAVFAPPSQPVYDFNGGLKEADITQILDGIVSILEGDSNNIHINKEIAPLLTQLQQILAQVKEPLEPGFEELLEEIMARMPQIEDITDTRENMAILKDSLATLRLLCPFENVNDEQKPFEQPIAEFASVFPVAGGSAKPADQSGGQGTNFSLSQNDENNDTQLKGDDKVIWQADGIAEGASFNIAPARLSFSEHFNAAASQPAMPLTADNLFAAMVERVISLPQASPHMEITLKPEHLGKLSIDLQLGAAGLSAKIIAGDEGVRNLLAAHLNRLSEALAERGIRVENVEVVYSALNGQDFNKRESAENYRENPAQANKQIKSNEPQNAQFWENSYDLPYWGNEDYWPQSSIEYNA
ncbi:MAG: flagellar hook-length control protein FliK [Clostridiales bacterium]|nr:flagellar hook-length control protein FliK [Clostridiales bacterium]